MSAIYNPAFTEQKFTANTSWTHENALPENLQVQRAQTETGVNTTLLNYLAQRFSKYVPMQVLELPCGNMEFAAGMKQVLPMAEITAADIVSPQGKPGIRFVQMDLSKPFTLPPQQYDLVTSVSGVMMFNNIGQFIESCCSRTKSGGTFIVTNDNSNTLKDRLTFLLFGNLRMFKPVFADTEGVVENVPVQALVKMLRNNGVQIKDIVYTSSGWKEYLFLPLGLLTYPLQRWYLRKFRQVLPQDLVRKMYPFKHLFSRHYIIITEKS
jgi:2-polyprenyl-3-methyl-5-hydroxy-6-metoxy-1,4-benzoquinol methylase